MMIIYIMSEWRLMNTRIETISLTILCERNSFNRDETEPYIYKLDGFSGNTISKTDWVRIKVTDNTANKWGDSNWTTSAPNEDVASLPTHTTYWVYGTEIKYGYVNTITELTTENAGQNITIAAGKTYTVNSDLTYTGTMTIESGGTLIIVSGKTLTIDGTINNDGIIRNDHTIYNNGTINNTGIINNYSVIANSNTITNTGSINSVQETETIGGTFSGSGTFNVIPTLTNDITEIANEKTYAVTSDVTINNNFIIKNGGTFIITGNGKLTIPDNITLGTEEYGTIVNYGTINNSYLFLNNGFFYNNGTIVNDNTFSNNNIFNNNGLFTNNREFAAIEGIFNNNGTIKNNNTLGLGNISFNTGIIDNYSNTIIFDRDGVLFSVQPKQNIGGSIGDEDASVDFFYPLRTFSSNIINIGGSEENISQSVYIVNTNVIITDLDLNEGALLIIQSGVTLTITGKVDNAGIIIINKNGIININNAGSINNGSVIINNGIIINSGTFNNFDGNEPIFYNFGTIKNDNTIKNNNNIINYNDESRIDNNGTINTIYGGITGKVTITDNAIKYGTFDEDMNFTET